MKKFLFVLLSGLISVAGGVGAADTYTFKTVLFVQGTITAKTPFQNPDGVLLPSTTPLWFTGYQMNKNGVFSPFLQTSGVIFYQNPDSTNSRTAGIFDAAPAYMKSVTPNKISLEFTGLYGLIDPTVTLTKELDSGRERIRFDVSSTKDTSALYNCSYYLDPGAILTITPP